MLVKGATGVWDYSEYGHVLQVIHHRPKYAISWKHNGDTFWFAGNLLTALVSRHNLDWPNVNTDQVGVSLQKSSSSEFSWGCLFSNGVSLVAEVQYNLCYKLDDAFLSLMWSFLQIPYKQGKSEGFDSCDRPSNLKLDSKSRFFSPLDLEIQWMTSKNNRTLLLY